MLYSYIFVHPFVRYRSHLLLPPHPLLYPWKPLVCQVKKILWTPSRISFVPFLLVPQGLNDLLLTRSSFSWFFSLSWGPYFESVGDSVLSLGSCILGMAILDPLFIA